VSEEAIEVVPVPCDDPQLGEPDRLAWLHRAAGSVFGRDDRPR
jgi:hypothetical protein